MATQRRSLLLYTTDMEAAIKEVKMRAGIVTIKLSSVFFVASVTKTLNAAILTKSQSTNFPEASLDAASALMLKAWRVVEEKNLIDTAIKRPITLNKSGTIAVALLMEADINGEVALPEVLAGTQSLALAESSANLVVTFDPYTVTGMVTVTGGDSSSAADGGSGGTSTDATGGSGGSSSGGTGSGTDSTTTTLGTIPPQAGLAFHQVTSAYSTAWPGLLNLDNKLYCFYQGFKNQAKRLFYKVLDGSSWSDETEIPDSVTLEGPSAAAFQGKIYLFRQGPSDKKVIRYSIFDGNSWSAENEIPNTRIEGGPCALVYGDKLYCIHQGWTKPNNTLWYNVFDGKKWVGDKMVDGPVISESPSAVVYNDLIYCFYQGYEISEGELKYTVFNPATGVWSGEQSVPNSKPMTKGPSASVVDGKIYLFHQGQKEGELYCNVSSDGTEWGQDTLVEEVSLVMGPSSIVYSDELYYFFQKGEGGNVTKGELWYRALKRNFDPIPEPEPEPEPEPQEQWSGANGDPSLVELGYSDGYAGYKELAAAIKAKFSTDHGYIVYLTKNTLLYDAYADEIRMCVEYPQFSNLPIVYAEIFAAEGIYDQRVISTANKTKFPPLTVSDTAPSYTLAVKADWQQLMSNARTLVFHRAADAKRSAHLWLNFFDKRTSQWVEIKGPVMSSSTATAAPVPEFGPDSALYVFYSKTTSKGESLCYTILSGSSWGEEKVVSNVLLTGSPAPLYAGSNINLFHEGPLKNGKLMYTYLDASTNTWPEPQLAYRIYPQGSPTAVLYKGDIYVFNQGQGSQQGKLAYSIWDQKKLTWVQGTVIAESSHMLTGEPTAVVYNEQVYCFYQGPSADGSLWYNIFTGSAWSGPTQVDMTYSGVKLQDGLSAFENQGQIHVFFRGRLSPIHQLLFHKIWDLASNTWSAEEVLPTASGLATKPGSIFNKL